MLTGLLVVAAVALAWLGYAYMSARALVKSKKKSTKQKESPLQSLLEDAGAATGALAGDFAALYGAK